MAVKLLERLVSFPTVAGESNEALVEYLVGWFEDRGARVTVVPSRYRPDGLNMYAVIGPPSDGGLLLAAHTDVVAVEGQPWSSDPFSLRRSGDHLYGRGTADMKGFIAAVLSVVAGINGRRLRRPLQIALSCDEELGCKGVPPLLDALSAEGIRPALGVIGEPTGMRIAARHKGKVGLRVELRGRARHSSAAPEGVNAVTYAARLIVAIDELGETHTTVDPAFNVPHHTVSVGPIGGGVSVNIVPDRCTFDVELRYLPGEDPEEIIGKIRSRAADLQAQMKAVAPEAGIELREVAAYPPLPKARDAVALASALGLTGGSIAVDFGSEAGLYHQRLGVPCVVCGPGDMAVAHRADEYLEVSQLRAAEQFVSRAVERLR